MSLSARHLVRFFRDDRAAVEEIADFASSGLELGERCVLAVHPERERALRRELELRGYRRRLDRVAFLDAAEAARRLAAGETADPAAFDEVIVPPVAAAAASSSTGRARVYGEIVNVLWRGGKEGAAAELERLWTRFGARVPFILLCGYEADALDCRCDLWSLAEAHEAVLPDRSMKEVDRSVQKAVEDVLGSQASMVRTLIASERRLDGVPFGQAALLWLGRHMPIMASKVVERARVRPA